MGVVTPWGPQMKTALQLDGFIKDNIKAITKKS